MERADSLSWSTILGSTAAFLLVTGFALVGWGNVIFGTHLDHHLYLRAALVRIFGTVVMADGCFAAALAQAEPRTQHRGVKWFALAHGLVLLMLILQRISTLDGGPVDFAIQAIVAAGAVFAFLWFTADGLYSRPADLFVSVLHPTPKASESAYDAQVRRTAAQEERNRLARDLHDSVKQQLFAIQTAAATAQTRYGTDVQGTLGAIAQVRESARDAMAEMEAMLDQLRAEPLENVGLAEALRRQCEALRHRAGTDVAFEVGTLPDNSRVPPGAHEALYRIGQEALANIARHARATAVKVRLAEESQALYLEVEDNGLGFDPQAAPSGMGLRNMRTRMDESGGEFYLHTMPGVGTRIVARVLLAEAVPARDYLRAAFGWTGVTVFGLDMLNRQQSFLALAAVTVGIIAMIRQLFAWAHARRPMT